jgi:hypothetical protein
MVFVAGMVLSLLTLEMESVSKQCHFGFIPENGLTPMNFSRSLWLEQWPY